MRIHTLLTVAWLIISWCMSRVAWFRDSYGSLGLRIYNLQTVACKRNIRMPLWKHDLFWKRPFHCSLGIRHIITKWSLWIYYIYSPNGSFGFRIIYYPMGNLGLSIHILLRVSWITIVRYMSRIDWVRYSHGRLGLRLYTPLRVSRTSIITIPSW